MFGFLKKKLKKVAQDISGEIEGDEEVFQEVSENALAKQDKIQLEQEIKSEVKSNEKDILKKEKKGFLGLFKKKSKVLNKEVEESELPSDKKIETTSSIKSENVSELEEIQSSEKTNEVSEPDKVEEISNEKDFEKITETSKIDSNEKEVQEKVDRNSNEEKIDLDKEVEHESEKELEEVPEEFECKKSIFHKLGQTITKLNITDEKFEKFFWELEVALLENNVAVEVIEKIKQDLKTELQKKHVTRKSIDSLILSILKKSINSLFNYEPLDLLKKIKNSEKPFKILFLGVNGAGKTTTLAKLIKYFQNNDISSVVSASDTFRAAAIQQLHEHAKKLNVKMISHDYGADPAAVAYDAIEHAKSKDIDVVLIDTAGRLHSNSNLMAELSKIIRVAKPDMKIFVGESITGNDCVEQATQFNEAVGIDAIILTKADVDEKGGVAISLSYVTGKPIIFITTGQNYTDIKPFNPQEVVDSLFE